LKEPTLRAVTRFDRFDALYPEMSRRFMKPTSLSGFEAPGKVRIDVSENDTGYRLRAEVAGAKKEASSHTLAIRGPACLRPA
jgi:HSP20 family molecular chaperone IbpA